MRTKYVGWMWASIFLFQCINAPGAWSAWKVGYKVQGEEAELISARRIGSDEGLSHEKVQLRSLPFFLPEGQPPSDELFEEWLVTDRQASIMALEESASSRQEPWHGSEVRVLVEQGPFENRINLTIVGDGYQESEKSRFFEDARRITDDLFGESTFHNYLPLFNVYAVFVPSRDSGITDTMKRDTALGLYRSPKNSKRAVMVGNSMAAERAIRLAPATDYPILLANDDYYGGLGGRYAVTTRSFESGSMVLRHELGHNFGNVGEEYDGGYVYRGANSSSGKSLKWDHWIESRPVRIFESRYLAGEYVWKDLITPHSFHFDFPAEAPDGAFQFQMLISSVGWSTPGDVEILLDGSPLPYDGLFTDDRSFFETELNRSLAPGRHRVEVRERVQDGNNVLAFAYAYAHEPDLDISSESVSGFATYNSGGRLAGYRPTHDACLMRNMRIKKFCAPDIENMWQRFLARVSLIDEVTVLTDEGGGKRILLQTPELQGLTVRWFERSDWEWIERKDLSGLKSWSHAGGGTKSFKALVSFETPEVRKSTAEFDDEAVFDLE